MGDKSSNVVKQNGRARRGEKVRESSQRSECWGILGKGGKTGYENNGLIVDR